jgi:hypothetical protein
MAIPAMIAGYDAYDHSQVRVELWTGSPFDVWHLSSPLTDERQYGDGAASECSLSETLWNYEIKPGLVRDISLCFTGGLNEIEIAENLSEQNKFDTTAARASGYTNAEIINYLFFQSSLDNAKKQLKRVEAAILRAKGMGEVKDARILALEAARLRLNINNYTENIEAISSDKSIKEPENWQKIRISEFAINSEMLSTIEKSLPQIEREALFEHLKTTLLLTAYWIGGIWIFSFVLGWIVRGFAGVPRGQDFKPDIKK